MSKQVAYEIAKLYCSLPPELRQEALNDDRITPRVKDYLRTLEERLLK